MLLEERQQKFMEELLKYGKVTVSDLANRFKISKETVRRDLDTLEKMGKLKRTHGGAVKILYMDNHEPYFDLKMSTNKDEKDKIAKKACDEIHDGDIIAIDTGTTTSYMCNYLISKNNLTVIVNNFYVLEQLISFSNNGLFDGKIFTLGGEVNASQGSCIGPMTEQFLNDIYVDKLFTSPVGFTVENGFTSINTYEAAISRKLMEVTRETFMLLDHSKVGVNNFYRISHINSNITIICDSDAPHEWEKDLNIHGCSWLKA